MFILLSSADGHMLHMGNLPETMLEISVVCNTSWQTPKHLAWDII